MKAITPQKIKRAFEKIFPQLQKPKRWRKNFDSQEQVMREFEKGNPFAENIVKYIFQINNPQIWRSCGKQVPKIVGQIV